MNSPRRRSGWKEALICFLLGLLIGVLVWLFLQPQRPVRQIIFGDLGARTASSIPSPAESAPPPPPVLTNAEPAAAPAISNAPAANALTGAANAGPGRPATDEAVADTKEKRDSIFGAIARNASNGLVGRYVGVSNFNGGPGMNSKPGGPAAPLSQLSKLSNTMAANAAMRAALDESPAPESVPPSAASAPQARSPASARTSPTPAARSVPGAAAPASGSGAVPGARASGSGAVPGAPASAHSPAAGGGAAAQSKAAGMNQENPKVPLPFEPLGATAPPLLFDIQLGTNVAFILDNSLDMATNRKSQVAREQLVRSLNAMDPTHSFYIILSHGGGYDGMPSLGPMTALPENIYTATNWLFSAGNGGAPDPSKAIQRAFSLLPAPDVIWILAGGPVPESSIDVVQNANSSILARVFTIGFYSNEAEKVLSRIANDNRGEYRYVPPPYTP